MDVGSLQSLASGLNTSKIQENLSKSGIGGAGNNGGGINFGNDLFSGEKDINGMGNQFASDLRSAIDNSLKGVNDTKNIAFENKAAPISFGGSGNAPTFSNVMSGFVNEVNQKSFDSTIANRNVMMGKTDNIVQAKILSEEAGVAWDLMLNIRNKVIEAYQELLRVQV
ncbi:MAG: hypothetical protein COZ46_04545 [Verrucomicrobia bacterium CG_4_10_14_3_um_filter_43_23]|nr:MAG: hypothetical protein AUJ82_06270 [Verrucomicrobia bacterium CG1_02_43_26]PIP58812.1 MAG: hypothetical protein COX01_06820 [Verrucomicrobia bacterium CG22_combo_CG10-13_8_21_14_all_43_17]PIX58291.1 MAG: hypothetical protein COZ46_04545 [Verrucomicrobia bacterium CG_4_10_14_3_um_filter_43_23]PIY62009.1 MAG: hypothetical protein COY94_03180 [Verrucomicrobia bacterium CG_4_10_14_0_8_um_filter_43_34]PJA44013.1 MAG: hypothetical protein CO175_05015 [Verrucomicrobia bacterium CG_4_9_14_3_um_fi